MSAPERRVVPRPNPRTARCGTPSGYRRHQLDGEKPCDACATAKREYDMDWRRASGKIQAGRRMAKAQRKAYQRLAHQFPDLYRSYYEEAKVEIAQEDPAPERRSEAQRAEGK